MTATTLRRIATLWPDLEDALGTPNTSSWPPAGLRPYLAALEQHDATEAAALRALERNPEQLGTRPAPISLRVHDTMRTVHAALLETCDQIAAVSQRPLVQPAPPNWPTKDRIRRNRIAAADSRDPQRWAFTGDRSAVRAALWLSARAEGRRWPGRILEEEQLRHMARVAAEALRRMEAALDLADGRRELTSSHPSPCCGATIEVYGGAGARPCARCTACGVIWHEGGVVAA